jgi:hypothetical protein
VSIGGRAGDSKAENLEEVSVDMAWRPLHCRQQNPHEHQNLYEQLEAGSPGRSPRFHEPASLCERSLNASRQRMTARQMPGIKEE